MTLKNNRAPLLCYFKLCASFCSHWWIQTGVTVRKRQNLGQIRRFLKPCDLKIWRMTLKNNRALLLCCFQLCAWFHCHMWIQTGVRVRKQLSSVLTSVTLTFDLWPCPFAWASLLPMVITPENFMMIRWWEHGIKDETDGRTDGQTDGQTDWTSHTAAWSQLKKTGLAVKWSVTQEASGDILSLHLKRCRVCYTCCRCTSYTLDNLYALFRCSLGKNTSLKYRKWNDGHPSHNH